MKVGRKKKKTSDSKMNQIQGTQTMGRGKEITAMYCQN